MRANALYSYTIEPVTAIVWMARWSLASPGKLMLQYQTTLTDMRIRDSGEPWLASPNPTQHRAHTALRIGAGCSVRLK